MKYNYFLTIVILNFLLAYSLNAQEQFERRYPAGQVEVITSSLTTAGTGYAMLGGELNDEDEIENLNITYLDNKGNITRSFSVTFDDTLLVRDIGSIISRQGGFFAFSAILEKDSLNKVIGLADKSTNVLFTTLTGKASDNGVLSNASSILVNTAENRIFHGHVIGAANNTTDLHLTIMDSILNVERIQTISIGTDLNERFSDMKVGLDSTIMVLGTTGDESGSFFISKLDSVGNLLWSHEYNGSFDRQLGSEGFRMTQLVDSSWIIVGSVMPDQVNRNELFILQIDNNGNIIQGRKMAPASTRYQLYPNGVVGMLDTTVVVSLKRIDMVDSVVRPVLISYDLDSTILYESLLDTCTDISAQNSSLVTNDSIGASFVTTTVKDGARIPYLAKADMTGFTQCNEIENVVVLDSVGFIVDSLVLTALDSIETDSVEVENSPFSNYDPPLLQLPDTIYCPQDPINFFVDATVRGGVNYIWDDGTTTASRTFTEEGMFMLTVTVREDLCFTLCDTMTITQRDLPSVSIEKDFGNFCETGSGTLRAIPMGPQIVSYTWNDGSMASDRFVEGIPAMYSVSVVDVCGNDAEDQIEVTEADLIPPVEAVIVRDCNILTVQGTGFIGQTWSNGETTPSINVTAPGTYTVTLQDECGDNVDTPLEITLEDGDFPEPVNASILLECGSPRLLTVVGTGISSQSWSTGQTTESIEIQTPGTYTVTVTGEAIQTPDGECQSMIIESINISQAEIDNSTGCLLWPNALFPLDNDVENQTFGPVVKEGCNNLISYEMRIYNRWGKNIFTTTNVNTRWNGSINGNNQPGGTYFYWARYDDGNTVCEREGDLTLLR